MKKIDKFYKVLKKGLETPDDTSSMDRDEHESKSKFSLVAHELSPEREQEIIDEIVLKIKNMKMETPAIMMLNMIEPVSPFISQVYGFSVAPFMELLGIKGYDYTMLFTKKKNVSEIIKKIEGKDRF